jgi:hypothetical protein
MATNTLVRYPQCGHEFDIEDAVAIQIKENIGERADRPPAHIRTVKENDL